MNSTTDWLPIPTQAIDTAPFWAQFYNVLNLFLPVLLAVVGLGVAALVVGRIIKQIFGGGGGD